MKICSMNEPTEQTYKEKKMNQGNADIQCMTVNITTYSGEVSSFNVRIDFSDSHFNIEYWLCFALELYHICTVFGINSISHST